MVEFAFPNGLVMDFEDASETDIKSMMDTLREEQPELFEEVEVKEEIERPDFSTATREEIREWLQKSGQLEGEAREPKETPTNEGEVRDLGFQFFFGRADDDEDREARLQSAFGPGTYKRVGYDDYFLLLDKISPELKEKYNLPESGTIRVNKPGFSRYDLWRGLGAEAAPLTAALGVGLMTSGVGAFPGMLLMAAAGAAGKGIDELVFERWEGLQTQSDDEIYGEMALTFAFYGIGELLGRGTWALGRRFFKGRGPTPDAQKIEELVTAGTGRAEAEIIVREEAKTQLRRAVAEGARPTISQVSGKAIAGRLQAIYEGIFPNQKAANLNRQYIDNTLGKFFSGEITEAETKEALNAQARSISAQVNNAMKNANADEAIQLANRHLEKVIDKEFQILRDLYRPSRGLDVELEAGINNAARTFEQDSSWIYGKVDDALKAIIVPGSVGPLKYSVRTGNLVSAPQGVSAATFGSKPIKEALRNIRADRATEAASQGAFGKGLFKYIGEQDTYTLKELTSLRTAIRLQGKDPSLMAGVTDRQVGTLVDAINTTIKNRLEGLAYLRTKGGAKMAFGPGATFNPATARAFSDAIQLYNKANKYHAAGMQRFKAGAVDALNKNLKERFFVGSKPVLEQLVEPGNAAKFNYYLKLITPSGKSAKGLTKANSPVFREAAELADKGMFTEANRVLEAAGITDKAIPRLPPFVEKLAANDPYKAQVRNEFVGLMNDFAAMSKVRANPVDVRNAFRDKVAREWLNQNYRSSMQFGGFAPSKFAQKFDELGAELQSAMFGKENAKALSSMFKDYHMVGLGKKEFANATAQVLGARATGLRQRAVNAVGGRTIAGEVANLQSVLKESIRQSDDKLFQAVRTGRLENADDLVESVLSNPANYDRLVEKFGLERMDLPMNIKDSVMARIIAPAFPDGITPDAVASGGWGNSMRNTIRKLNGKTDIHGTGSLSKILGQDTVDDLIKFSNLGERISDSALRSKTGLAPAAFAAGAGFRMVSEPLIFLREALGIFTLGRVLRQKWLIDGLLAPRWEAGAFALRPSARGGRRLYQRAIEMGADIDQPISPFMMELRERVTQEARLMAAAQMKPGPDVRETVREEVIRPGMEAIEQVSEEVGPDVQGLSDQVGGALGISRPQAAVAAPPQALAQVAQAQETPEQRALRVLAAREEAKLTGAPVTA